MKRIILLILLALFASLNSFRIKEEKYLISVLWQQTSAEYRALCYQAYNLAEIKIFEQKENAKLKAVVIDVDETILDNSPYRAEKIKNDEFSESFGDWIKKEKAETIPGALEFLQKADSLGFHIFYITNRDEKYREFTANNLNNLKFPQVSKAHLLMRQNRISDKSPRRNFVSEKYEIILLIGDNLVDFSQIFYGENIQDRNKMTNIHKKDFGNKYIILPNPNHGRWKKMFYQYKEHLSEEEKRERFLENLKGVN